VLALLDLDGTITRHDTLPAYLGGFVRQHPARLWRAPLALPTLLRFAVGKADHGQVKSACLTAVLAGRTRAELEAWTARFVPRLIAYGLFADALAAITAHRDAGDHLVLLSASTDLYVPAIGRALGFAQTLCTGVEWQADRLTGRLATANRRGAEKARCLEELRVQHPQLPIVAYGNATSDLAHLAIADRGVLVNGSWRARRAAGRLGVVCVRWR
jgi:phosphatidylglycerophosphatase C